MFFRVYLRAIEQDAQCARGDLERFDAERGMEIAACYVENEAARRALLRLAVTHPDGERAVAAVLAAVGGEMLGQVLPARMPEVGKTAGAVQGAVGVVRH